MWEGLTSQVKLIQSDEINLLHQPMKEKGDEIQDEGLILQIYFTKSWNVMTGGEESITEEEVESTMVSKNENGGENYCRLSMRESGIWFLFFPFSFPFLRPFQFPSFSFFFLYLNEKSSKNFHPPL